MGNEGSQPFKYGETLENDVKVNWINRKKETSFPGREGHCSCSLGKLLYVFGGVTQSADGNEECNTFFVYDLEKNEVEEIKGEGEIPPARAGATFVTVGSNLYLFGGLNYQLGWLEEVFAFDTKNSTWRKVETTGTAPTGRDKLASAVIGDKIYIFGGFGPQGMEEVELEEDEDDQDDEDEGTQFGWFNDLFIFDTTNNAWSNPMQMNVGAPTPRAAAAMTSVGKYLVIFGGKDAEARKNDLYIFDTETRKWVTDLDKVVSGRQPEPRSFHSATTVGHRIVITGGRGIANQHFQDFHIFDTETKEWLQPTVEGDVPGSRGAHTATVVGEELILYGGSSDFDEETGCCRVFLSDVYSVNTADVTTGKSLPKVLEENKENVSGSSIVSTKEAPLKPVDQVNAATMETS